MKKGKLSALFVLLALTLSFVSCNTADDETANADYLGTWSLTETVSQMGISMSTKRTIIITKDLYSIVVSTQPSPILWIDIMKVNGTYVIDGAKVTITPTEVGIIDPKTGTLKMNKKGDALFDSMVADAAEDMSFVSEYSVSGNKLTLKSDLNGDKDYLDEYETQVYTKQ